MKQQKTRQRQKAILDLLKNNRIENQLMLVQLLEDKYGIKTTQSMVSRDMQEIGVLKKTHKDATSYHVPPSNTREEILRLSVTDIASNDHTIIVSVIPGLAAFVADFLDSHKDNCGILGTLAGENTIFIAPHDTNDIKRVYNNICNTLYFKPFFSSSSEAAHD